MSLWAMTSFKYLPRALAKLVQTCANAQAHGIGIHRRLACEHSSARSARDRNNSVALGDKPLCGVNLHASDGSSNLEGVLEVHAQVGPAGLVGRGGGRGAESESGALKAQV